MKIFNKILLIIILTLLLGSAEITFATPKINKEPNVIDIALEVPEITRDIIKNKKEKPIKINKEKTLIKDSTSNYVGITSIIIIIILIYILNKNKK